MIFQNCCQEKENYITRLLWLNRPAQHDLCNVDWVVTPKLHPTHDPTHGSENVGYSVKFVCEEQTLGKVLEQIIFTYFSMRPFLYKEYAYAVIIKLIKPYPD